MRRPGGGGSLYRQVVEAAGRRLPLAGGTSGPMFAMALVYAVVGGVIGLLGAVYLVDVPTHQAGPCEAGKVGVTAAALSFLCMGVIVGRPALHDLVAAVRGRRGGAVTLTDHSLLLEVPGLLTGPCVLDRSWIEDVRCVGRGRDDKEIGGRRGDLRFSMTKPHVALRFSRPVQIEAAAYVPRALQRFAPLQPAPWSPLDVLTLEPEDPVAFTHQVDEWLRATAPADPAARPPVVPRSRRRLVRFVVPAAIAAAAFAVFSLSIPSGPGC